MDRLYKTPSPLHTPVGTPTKWYSPTHTPSNTPIGSLSSGHAPHHRRSNESLHSAISDRLSTHQADINANEEKVDEAEPGGEMGHLVGSLPSIEESPEYKAEEASGCCARCTFSTRELLTICTLCYSNVCSAMFASLLAPFFPTEAVEKGVSQTWIGLIFGSFQLISFVMCPFWGHHISSIGAKFMFIAGICVCGSCAILFGMLQWCPPGMIYIIMCFLTRSLESVASAAASTANMAIATYTFPMHVSTVIGTLNACSCIGLMIGPPIGGALYEAGGFYLPFLVTGSTYIASGIICICALPTPKEPIEDKSVDESAPKVPKTRLLRYPIIFVAGYLTLIGQFAIGYIDVVFTIHLSDTFTYLTPTWIGLIFLIAPLVVVALAPACGAIVDKYPVMARPIMIVGAIISAAGFAGLGPSFIYPFLPSEKLWVVLASLAFAGVGWGAIVVTYQEFNNAARRRGFAHSIETQGLVSGVYNAFSNLGAFLGPVVGGVLNEQLGFVNSSTVVAGLIAYAGVQVFVYTIIEALCCDVPPLPPPDNAPSYDDTQKLLTSQQQDGRTTEDQNTLSSNEYQPTGNRLYVADDNPLPSPPTNPQNGQINIQYQNDEDIS